MSAQSKGRSAGVLPVNAAARKSAAVQSASKPSQRTPAPRLRLIVRRLPPGLTEAEFWTTLGDEWRIGNGKVDWAAYKDGKVSRDPAKPSQPARAYLRVKDQSFLETLSKVVRGLAFQDARNSTKDSCLLGPPSLEFAPYNKTPSDRVRHDGRQGTIDQDQEFIDFLQGLTEPLTKLAANGTDSAESKPEAVTVTPLVQYIKEKKANKAKEAAQAKAAKSASKEAKPTKNERPPTVIIKGKATSTAADKEKEKERIAKATQDAVKAVQKSVAAASSKQTPVPPKIDTKQPVMKEAQPSAPPAKQERTREPRDNARGAARMLQRDLGLLVKGNTSPRTPKSASSASNTTAQTNTPAAKPSDPATSPQKTSAPATPTTPSAPPTGPRASRTPSTAASASAKQTPTAPAQPPPTQAQSQTQPRQPKAQPSSPQPSTGAKSAFLKHANPSQGITEDLLKEAFKPFGTLTRCEIDKKKGLGYIDFAEAEGLKKAMASSPIKVGNGQVVVLENKSQQGKRGGGGPSAGGQKAATTGNSKPTTTPAQGGANVSSPKPAAATPSPAATSTPQVSSARGQTPGTPTTPASPALVTSTPATGAPTAANTPPTAPRGASRSGGRSGGGSGRQVTPRSGGAGQSQNQNPAPGGRQGHRGGRAGFRGGGRGVSAAAASTSISGGGETNSGTAATAPPPATATAKDESKTA